MREIKMNMKKQIGLRLKEIRKRRGLSQEALAERAETSPNYLSRMERGTENPTLDMLIKIAVALEVELWELFDYKHKTNTKELREMLKGFATEVKDEEKLQIAVRVLRSIAR
jgi:transcriptional regulator with XRE-family HTH domain